MRLYELAFACYLYRRFGSHYDEAYTKFRKATGDSVDIENLDHRRAMLTWLNEWGCRQFAKKYHELASEEIKSWYREFSALLPNQNRHIWELTDLERETANQAHVSLSLRVASYREKRDGIPSQVTVGETGAAKIMFAIKPDTFIPWDDSMRKYLRDNYRVFSYGDYLRHAKDICDELEIACRRINCQLSDLPRLVDRGVSTVPKLIDEYHWVTVTNNCHPTSGIFQQWAQWDKV